MKRKFIYSICVLAIASVTTTFCAIGHSRPSQPAASLTPREPGILIGAPGLVEPLSEQVQLSAQVAGRLQEVLVDAGDPVRKGQVIAVLEDAESQAHLATAEARLRVAATVVNEAKATLDNVSNTMARCQVLLREEVVSHEEAERAEGQYRVEQARYDAAVQRVALARAELEEARVELEKTRVRSPLTGIVIRKDRQAGESVTASPDMPIVTVADVSHLRVRMEVDEADVAKVQVGQPAYVTADAYPSKKFSGRVVRIGQVLGRKNIHTDEPTECVDTKILETLIQLDDGHELPLRLRVDAFITSNETTVKQE